MTLPLVSVIIPAYNAEPYLAETLDTLLAQTFQDWRAVVIDDGSSDRTAEIAHDYASKEPRIQVLSQPNQGLPRTRNRAMAELPGHYFAFLDADDLWHPEKLERQLAAARDHDVHWVYCAHRRFGPGLLDTDSSDWKPRCTYRDGSEMLESLAAFNYIIPSCVLVSKEAMDKVGGFEEKLIASEDWDMWLRLARSGYSSWGDPDKLCDYRVQSSGLASQRIPMFLGFMHSLPRYLPPELLVTGGAQPYVQQFFRDTFYHATPDQAIQIFDAYRPIARPALWLGVMGLLKALLPPRGFWFASRYGVIPLAKLLERLEYEWQRRRG